MQLVIALVLHFVCDYVVQRMTWDILPHKLESMMGMLIHAAYAEGPAMLALSINAGNAGTAMCLLLIPMHYIIDTLGGKGKSTVAKCVDQFVHIALLVAAYLVR